MHPVHQRKELTEFQKSEIVALGHDKCKGGGQDRRKAGSGATKQGTDQQGWSGNGEAMNKFNKQVKQVKQGKQGKQGKQVES